jgi:hypothetical protein
MLAALMIGHHFAISAFRQAASPAGVWRRLADLAHDTDR